MGKDSIKNIFQSIVDQKNQEATEEIRKTRIKFKFISKAVVRTVRHLFDLEN